MLNIFCHHFFSSSSSLQGIEEAFIMILRSGPCNARMTLHLTTLDTPITATRCTWPHSCKDLPATGAKIAGSGPEATLVPVPPVGWWADCQQASSPSPRCGVTAAHHCTGGNLWCTGYYWPTRGHLYTSCNAHYRIPRTVHHQIDILFMILTWSTLNLGAFIPD